MLVGIKTTTSTLCCGFLFLLLCRRLVTFKKIRISRYSLHYIYIYILFKICIFIFIHFHKKKKINKTKKNGSSKGWTSRENRERREVVINVYCILYMFLYFRPISTAQKCGSRNIVLCVVSFFLPSRDMSLARITFSFFKLCYFWMDFSWS